MMKLLPLLTTSLLSSVSYAETLNFDFSLTWVHASPDGYDRPVIGINNQWPIPTIRGTKGDRVVINLSNDLGNRSTSLHFHGLYQNKTAFYDGATGATQCLIPPGGKVTYDFWVWRLLNSTKE